MPDNLELAWAAGLFDGEGSVGMVRPTRTRDKLTLTVSIHQRTPDVLVRFQTAVGGLGRMAGPFSSGAAHNPMYQFTANGGWAEQVMRLIEPYISAPKQAQWARAFESWTTVRDSWRPGGKRGQPTPCINGHDRTPGTRCRICDRDGSRRYRINLAASAAKGND